MRNLGPSGGKRRRGLATSARAGHPFQTLSRKMPRLTAIVAYRIAATYLRSVPNLCAVQAPTALQGHTVFVEFSSGVMMHVISAMVTSEETASGNML